MNLLSNIRKVINPPYSAKDLLVIFGVLAILVSIPLTVSLSTQRPSIAPRAASSTIAFDSASSIAPIGSINPVKWLHTTSSGSNRILIVGTSSEKNTLVVSVTYGGMSLTRVTSKTSGNDSSDDARVEIWYLLSPPPGTYDVTINKSNSSNDLIAGATGWTGVDQGTPLGVFNSSAATEGTMPSVSVSSADNEVVVDTLATVNRSDVSTQTASVGGGQIERWNHKSGGATKSRVAAGSSKPGAAVSTMYWTLARSSRWAMAAVSLKPVQPPPSCSNECSPSGAKQCIDGSHYKTCGNFDTDTCSEWSAATACPSGNTCSGGVCKSGGGTPGGGGSGSGGSTLDSLQLEISVPYLTGSLKAKVDVGGVSKEVELSGGSRGYNLDLKDSKLSLNKEYNLSITSDKTLVKKVNFTPAASATNLKVGDLILGDLNQDNTIGSADQLELINFITGQTLVGDLNADKVVNSFDWAVLLENFGKKGD